jgi:GH25 family lysozyme M1 (1,4-beta-N-acetylmuramidase)/predicted RNA-binding Zn-ribbon protein involved in translation (DUF1610 family)
MARGIDISHWQSDVNFTAVRNDGIQFVMLKATEGVDYVDDKFTDHASGALAAGLPIGAYHFLRAGDAAAQADDFLEAIRPYSVTYPVACDVENKPGTTELSSLGRDKLTDMVLEFCARVKAAGYKPVVYSNYNWLYGAKYLDADRIRAAGYGIWMAWYSDATPEDTDRSSLCDMWQYASDGHVDGIDGLVDMDVSYVDYTGTGTGTQPSEPLSPAPTTIQSDTPSTLTLQKGATYQFKLTGTAGVSYTFGCGNTSIIRTVSVRKSGGSYYYKIAAVGTGIAGVYATPQGGSGTRFCVVTVEAAQSPPGPSPQALQSDTPSTLTMEKGATYQFKLTGTAGVPYTFGCGNTSIIRTVSVRKSGGSYYYKIAAVGTGIAGVYATPQNGSGTRFCVVTVKAARNQMAPSPQALKSDTPLYFTMKKGATYQFKLTGTAGVSYTFGCGNTSIIRMVSVRASGGSYYCKIAAAGTGTAGVYATPRGGTGQRFCIVTVQP